MAGLKGIREEIEVGDRLQTPDITEKEHIQSSRMGEVGIAGKQPRGWAGGAEGSKQDTQVRSAWEGGREP